MALLYFGCKAFYFCLRVRKNIFPDEVTHFGRVELFSRSLLPPGNSADSFALGLIEHVPTLYYAILGKLVHLNFFGMSDLIFLRCINVLFGMASVFYAWRFARLVIPSAFVRSVFVVLLTNTLMFTFLSGGVNYDNLANLFAVMSLYHLFSYVRTEKQGDLLGFLITLCAGTLTKISILPYAFLLVCILVYHRRKTVHRLISDLAFFRSPFAVRRWAGGTLLMLLLFLNLNLYAVNVVRFGHLVPEPLQVLTEEQAMQNRIFARNRTVELFQQREITYEQAMEMSARLSYPGDQVDVRSRLGRIADERKRGRPSRSDRISYFFPWTDLMLARIYGVAAHQVMWREDQQLVLYRVIYLLAFVLLVRRFRREQMNGMASYLIVIFFLYALILMQLVNYKTYSTYGILGMALQGRYLFPVIVPMYALMSFYLLDCRNRRWSWAAGVVLGAVFIYGEFPWFLQKLESARSPWLM